jgi:hypothetical protein
MSNEQQEPFRESHLDSPEYRERLMRKLNCLIAVLEVATAKVDRSIEGPGADVERLGRIRTNLRGTLDVCLRARAALERREALPANLPENLAAVVRETAQEMKLPTAKPGPRPSTAAEFASDEERSKFRVLRPIQKEEIRMTDLEDLIRRLQAG